MKLRIVMTNDYKNITLDAAIKAWETLLTGISKHSHKAKFKYDLPYFVGFLQSVKRIKTPMLEDLSKGHLEDFIDYRLKMEAPKSVCRRVDTLTRFAKACADSYEGFVNSCVNVSRPIVDKLPPKRLGKAEFKKILAELEKAPEGFLKARNRLLLELLGNEGLRCHEVAVLCMAHLSQDMTWITKVSGKGRHFRQLPLRPSVQAALKKYLPLRDERMQELYRLWGSTEERLKLQYPLLITGRKVRVQKPIGYRVSDKTIWRIVQQLGSKAGIEGVHPHLLRHEFAHDRLEATNDVVVVSKLLGHQNINTTMIYVNPLSERLLEAMA